MLWVFDLPCLTIMGTLHIYAPNPSHRRYLSTLTHLAFETSNAKRGLKRGTCVRTLPSAMFSVVRLKTVCPALRRSSFLAVTSNGPFRWLHTQHQLIPLPAQVKMFQAWVWMCTSNKHSAGPKPKHHASVTLC